MMGEDSWQKAFWGFHGERFRADTGATTGKTVAKARGEHVVSFFWRTMLSTQPGILRLCNQVCTDFETWLMRSWDCTPILTLACKFGILKMHNMILRLNEFPKYMEYILLLVFKETASLTETLRCHVEVRKSQKMSSLLSRALLSNSLATLYTQTRWEWISLFNYWIVDTAVGKGRVGGKNWVETVDELWAELWITELSYSSYRFDRYIKLNDWLIVLIVCCFQWEIWLHFVLCQVLSNSKRLSEEISTKQEVASKTEDEIDQTRNGYKPV